MDSICKQNDSGAHALSTLVMIPSFHLRLFLLLFLRRARLQTCCSPIDVHGPSDRNLQTCGCCATVVLRAHVSLIDYTWSARTVVLIPCAYCGASTVVLAAVLRARSF